MENSVDNILQQVGITTPDNASPAEENTETPQSLSDSDIEDILHEHGFTPVPETQPQEDVTRASFNEEQPVDTQQPEEEEQPVAEQQSVEEQPEAPAETTHPQIPLNSPTLLVDDSTSRFSGAEWYQAVKESRIILAGLGGIGSHVAFNLARMHPSAIFMYDDDTVEEANLSGQFYSTGTVGISKVSAMGDILRQYTESQSLFCINQKFTETSEAGPIMICGFDNMRARRTFYTRWQEYLRDKTQEQREQCLFIDGRLSLTVMQVLCLTGNDTYNMEQYENHYLFSDNEAEHTVCSMKQTTYLASMIGAYITNLFTNFIANTLNPAIPYALPFFTEYNAPYMIFNTRS